MNRYDLEKRLPRKGFTVQLGSQEPLSTCVALSAATARSISYAIERGISDPDSLRRYAFSPEYLYYCIKNKLDSNSMEGASIIRAMDTLIERGIVPRDSLNVACPPAIRNSLIRTAAFYRIKDKSLSSTAGGINEWARMLCMPSRDMDAE